MVPNKDPNADRYFYRYFYSNDNENSISTVLSYLEKESNNTKLTKKEDLKESEIKENK